MLSLLSCKLAIDITRQCGDVFEVRWDFKTSTLSQTYCRVYSENFSKLATFDQVSGKKLNCLNGLCITDLDSGNHKYQTGGSRSPTDTISECLNVIHTQRHFATTLFHVHTFNHSVGFHCCQCKYTYKT